MRKLFLLLALVGMFATACENDSIMDPSKDGESYSIVGSVQKGPFVLGSSITVQPLNNKLNPTGQVYTTTTNDDAGHFNLGSVLSSKYAQILATGYYFDEVVGNVSRGTLTLRSVTDLDDSGVANVNLLTTLVMQRAVNLVNNKGMKITEATTQSERELFLTLGIKENDIPSVRFSKMDISQAGDHNALLLAVSIALQYGRTTGELAELIAKLAADLADDGVIASDKVQGLYIRESAEELTCRVRRNLISRYNQLGVACTIPEFDKYMPYFLDIDGNGIADKDDGVVPDDLNIEIGPNEQSFTLPISYIDIDNCDISFGANSSDAANWLTITIDDNIVVSASHNLTNESREAEIVIIEHDSNKSTSFTIRQQESYAISFSYDASSLTEFVIVCDTEPFHTAVENGDGVCYYIRVPTIIYEASGAFTSVTIPDSIETIRGAFASCTTLSKFKGTYVSEDGRSVIKDGILLAVAPAGLTEYTTTDDVHSIGISAFQNYTSLQSVTIGSSVRGIENCAFAYCNNVELFTLKSMIPPALGDGVFDGIENLRISIPEEAIEAYLIIDWPYEYRRAIIEFEDLNKIPEIHCIYYTTIDDNKLENKFSDSDCKVLSHTYSDGQGVIAFFEPLVEIWGLNDSYNLESVIIPNGVTTICNQAFSYCCNLENIYIPASVILIEDYAFIECSSLENVTIPCNVISIGEYAFHRCERFTNITIPDSVSSIGNSAFGLCIRMESINIPDSVTNMGDGVFELCENLKNVTLGRNLNSIGRDTFKLCSSLTDIVIPDNVTSIGECAFHHCENLKSITIPDMVAEIGEGAFSACASLTSIIIPESVREIKNDTFCGCNGLTNVTIPDGVTKVGKRAFSGCFSLASLYCKPTIPPKGSYDMFEDGTIIYVPMESVEAYKAASKWEYYADNIVGYDF